MVDFGSALLSTFLQVLFDRVTSREVVEFLLGQRSTDGISKKMEIALLSLNAVLEDAEEKQVAELVVKRWLDELKDAVHDAEDILDEIAAKTLRRELDAEFQNPANTVRNSISSTIFIQKTERKTKNVLDRLEYLATQKDVIGLREGVGRKPSERLPTTSLVDNTCIFGREKDKEAIINLLVSDDTSANELALIAIAGMGGIGKTTLAQLVYNDARVEEHFDLQAWVCVSDEFDVFNVMKTILEEVGSSSYGESKNLNWLQVTLKKMLMGKKFLLVLDDVWDLNYATWELLSSPFKFGAQGSRVIVTTREEHLALVMRATKTYKLNQLPEEDCWSIFAKYALRNRNFDSHPELEELGRKIVKKCKGLPLAIKQLDLSYGLN